MKQLKPTIVFILLVICGIFLVAGCTKVKQARKAPKSGFLGDYSQLKEVGGDKAMLVYVNPDADFSLYDKVILYSVSIWYTENFGGRDIVAAYDSKYESVGAWYNDISMLVTQIDFFGSSDQGQLKRVETLKSGMFWHVWVEFFQHTDINRVGRPADTNDVTPEKTEAI